MIDLRPCPVCGASSNHEQIVGTLRCNMPGDYSQTEFSLHVCECRSAAVISPSLTAEDEFVLYSKGGTGFKRDWSYDEETSVLAYASGCWSRAVRKVGKDSGSIRLLEIGAGSSWMCRAAKKHNHETFTAAQDVAVDASVANPWADYFFLGPLDQAPTEAHGTFDVVSITHVLEFANDPGELLGLAGKYLAPNGVLLLTGALWPRNWRPSDGIQPWRDYPYAQVPSRRHYFNKGGIEALCAKAGLRILDWDDSHGNGCAFEAWLRRNE